MHGITNSNYATLMDNGITINIRPYAKARRPDHPDFSYCTSYWTTLIVHEFAHGFINPLIKKHTHFIEKINIIQYAQLLKELCYGISLETYISETVIRSLECLYVKERFPELYEEFSNDYIEKGYSKIGNVIKIIEDKNALDFENCIPQIINVFTR